jgi:hypothetical protein
MSIGGFDKSIEELLHFGDSFKLHEKQLKQQYAVKLNRQKNEYDVQLQKEKEQVNQLQEKNRALTNQIEEMTGKQIDSNEQYAVMEISEQKNESISFV